MGVGISAAFGFLLNGSGYSDWPGLEQVFEIRRGFQFKGVWKEAVRYGVTSLPAMIANPERLLKLKRGHWTIGATRFAETSEKLGDGEQGGEKILDN